MRALAFAALLLLTGCADMTIYYHDKNGQLVGMCSDPFGALVGINTCP
jgi:hypothetical protein